MFPNFVIHLLLVECVCYSQVLHHFPLEQDLFNKDELTTRHNGYYGLSHSFASKVAKKESTVHTSPDQLVLLQNESGHTWFSEGYLVEEAHFSTTCSGIPAVAYYPLGSCVAPYSMMNMVFDKMLFGYDAFQISNVGVNSTHIVLVAATFSDYECQEGRLDHILVRTLNCIPMVTFGVKYQELTRYSSRYKYSPTVPQITHRGVWET